MLAFVGLQFSEKMYFKEEFPGALFADDITEIKEREKIRIISCFYKTGMDKKVLSQFPSLRFIVTQSTGYNHIDVKECKKRGIVVYNVPDYGTETIGEYTILLMLSLLRKFKVFEGSLRKNVDVSNINFVGREAFGKTLGVLGTGKIGSRVVMLANSFGMKILAYDKYENKELIKKYGVKYTSLDKLFRNSDIITLHLNLTDETKHVINEKAIAKMRKGVLIINTARGGLIETMSLAKGLEIGRIGGVALDVIEAEDLIARENEILRGPVKKEKLRQAFIGNMLMQRDNVILTPHIAYDTEEALRRISEKTTVTINEIQKGNLILYNKVV